LKATLGFHERHLLGQAQIHFLKIGLTDERILFRHLLPRDLEPLFCGNLLSHWKGLYYAGG
jgi:hypothetical protein